MQMCGPWPIGVCSWSFQKGIDEIGSVMTALGVKHINLAIAPALGPDGAAYLEAVKRQDWIIYSGMMNYDFEDYTTLESIKKSGGIMPDEHWPASGEAFAEAARITAELGSEYIMMHAGFLDHDNEESCKKFYDRVRYIGDRAKEHGVTILLETGQESAADLKKFMETLNHPNVLLNFDPANMILYNQDQPIDVFKDLVPWVRQIHIKDAIRTKVAGEWGVEVPWGDGEVNSFAFLNVMKEAGFEGVVAIEREAGAERVKDIATAVRRLMAY